MMHDLTQPSALRTVAAAHGLLPVGDPLDRLDGPVAAAAGQYHDTHPSAEI
jgi:hypothetical protein